MISSMEMMEMIFWSEEPETITWKVESEMIPTSST